MNVITNNVISRLLLSDFFGFISSDHYADIVIIKIMQSKMLGPKVITLTGFYCFEERLCSVKQI